MVFDLCKEGEVSMESNDNRKEGFIDEPKIFPPLEGVIRLAERRLGGKMLPARLLLWTPKAFVSSMILEGLIAHKRGKVD